MADLGEDFLSLYGGDDAQAQATAQSIAQAMRQRRMGGMLGVVSGDPAMAAMGKESLGSADQMQQALMGAAQHRAQQAIEAKRLDNQTAQLKVMMGYRQGELDTRNREVDERIKARLEELGLKKEEVGATPDALGNPILYRKHGNASVLPGAVGAAGAASSVLTPEAKAMLADQFKKTGQIPQVGRGRAGPAIISSIVNAAAASEPNVDLAGNKAAYTADTSSLKKQQALLDLTQSWESTGKANLGVLRGVSQQLVNAGSPLINRPLRFLYEKMAGDPTVTKFKAAHAAVVNEYAKILSGATGGAGVTEGARHEAEQMLPLDSTPAQISAAADLLETDAGNRLSALKAQVAATQARTSGKAAAPAVDKDALRKKYGL